MWNSKFINLRGDLFATAFSFSAQAIIKLGSSMILTRILRPEAYGIVTILMSILFVVDMIADFGFNVFIIRAPNAEDPRYFNTAWTMRLWRAGLNSTAVFLLAPWIAALYSAPALTAPLRVFSASFIVGALESMSFPVAIRRKRSRIIVYSELLATCVSTAFSVIYCYYSRDFWGMVYGVLLNKLAYTLLSYRFFPEIRPRLQYDRTVARELWNLSKYTMPSSMLSLALSQFDKVVFLRLFDLRLLGVYGLASNIAGPIEALVSKISQTVLYPRCAHNFRNDRKTASIKYYMENVKLFASILVVPAAIGGSAQFVIAALYPSRYAETASVLQAFMVRAALLSLASPAEDLLIAAGESKVILVGNVYRAIWLFAGSIAGYYLFGFIGFTYGAALSALPPLVYYLWLQRRMGLLIMKYEFYKLAFMCGVAISAFFVGRLLLTFWPETRHWVSFHAEHLL
jgi:lipopolysaccharide exporter